jgi:catalase
LFDAVLVALTPDATRMLASQPAAISFVHDAFSHLKVIGYLSSAQPLLDKAGVLADEGVVAVEPGTSAEKFVSKAAGGRIWAREPKLRPAL